MNTNRSYDTQQISHWMGEQVVWNDLKGGDTKALSYIYSRYFKKLYNYGSKIASDTAFVEDCIQDLFIELWNKRAGLSDVRNMKHYLYKSLRRKIIYKLSQHCRNREIHDLGSFELELSHRSHYLSQQISTEIHQRLIHIIQALSPKQKEAIFLIYYDELSYEEVASIMSLKVKTVYNLIHLAVSKLKEHKSSLSFHTISFLL